jgi:DNA-directed RNA polymerase subunit beta
VISATSVPHEEEGREPFPLSRSILEVPDLNGVQLNSYRWFQEEGLRKLFEQISPIKDLTGNKLELRFGDYEFHPPEHSEQECQQRDMTYSTSLHVKVQLIIKETGEVTEQDIFMGDIPLMTPMGTFIINGTERVVVSQLIRSPGAYFSTKEDIGGRELCSVKLIPERGAWLEFETSSKDVLSVKIDGKRRIPVTILLNALGYSNTTLTQLLGDVDNSSKHQFIKSTIEHDPLLNNTEEEALTEIFNHLRPGEPLNLDNARTLITNLFFNPRHYNLGEVGRYKLSTRLGIPRPVDGHGKLIMTLTKQDMLEIVRRMIMVNNEMAAPDDIDHLGNRRLRTVGELIQNHARIGLLRLERVVRERMSIVSTETTTPKALINIHPLVAAMREFFAGSQLSQFMDQTNPLAELTHKRRLSALGPGGLSRERAGVDVRDVHHSHYGRICPIETPEGPNIGLIGSLTTYASVNRYGFIVTPYRKVLQEVINTENELLGRTVREAITDGGGSTIVQAGTVITSELAHQLAGLPRRTVKVAPFVSDQIDYLSADREEKYIIAQANAQLDPNNQFISEKVQVRQSNKFLEEPPDSIDYMDLSPVQLFSVTTALIPFLEHNDANRALMGSNMQRQAVPLIRSEFPLVSTGMEEQIAHYSNHIILSESEGEVLSATADQIMVEGSKEPYTLRKFVRTNQGTCFNQHPLVSKGDRVRQGQVLADSYGTAQGKLALGQNVLCAFMSWKGYNYEDAIIISRRLVEEDKFTSIHIERYEIQARDTKLGKEEITRDIPNIGEEGLRNLDENGIIRIGSEVSSGDILVGKITPKGETELSAEEKLLRAIFGEKAREVKDSSLRVPHGEMGTVIDVREIPFCAEKTVVEKITNARRQITLREALKFQKDVGIGETLEVTEGKDELPAGVNHMVRVSVAKRRRVTEGDKLSGRHGNKGVVARILPVEDMPFLSDGTPVEIILNPIGVPSRMNLGQVLETHLGCAAYTLGFNAISPVFEGANDTEIEDALARVWLAQRAGAIKLNPDEANTRPTFKLEIAETWLRKYGYDGERIFSTRYPGEARRACLRLWLEDIGIATAGLDDEEVKRMVGKLSTKDELSPPIHGKTILYDGQTGEPFDQPVTVGSTYVMKLIHLVEDKVHSRSTGPYSLITQQPLGGKAQFGGQRFGEMEVWALEAYGASHVLQEMLTIKSDDVAGRAKAYESIIKGEDIQPPGIPESFKVLVKELQSLGLAVEALIEEEKESGLIEEEPIETPKMETMEISVEELEKRGENA